MAYKIGIYPERWESIEKLSLEDKGKILENIFYYSTKGEIPHNSYIEVIFNFMKNRIDADRGEYDKICRKNKERSIEYWNKQKITTGIPADTTGIPADTTGIPAVSNSNSNYNYTISKDIDITKFSDPLPKQKVNEQITAVVDYIKKKVADIGCVYNSEKEREFSKHLLSKKFDTDILEYLRNKTGEEIDVFKGLDIMFMILGDKNNWRYGKVSGPMGLYQNASKIFNSIKGK